MQTAQYCILVPLYLVRAPRDLNRKGAYTDIYSVKIERSHSALLIHIASGLTAQHTTLLKHSCETYHSLVNGITNAMRHKSMVSTRQWVSGEEPVQRTLCIVRMTTCVTSTTEST